MTMHKLERPDSPACLNRCRHGRDNWSSLTPEDREVIWQRLDHMQQGRCAYCESRIPIRENGRDGHIEHFRQRSRYPEGTFQWSNLFGSCNRQESCGIHKDRLPPYDPALLIKPDEENPNRFFRFISNGTISIRENLTPEDRNRAGETLRILNLDARSGPLRHMRKAAVQGYIQTGEFLAEMAGMMDADEWNALIREELAAIRGQPFETAIRHVLVPV